MPTRLKRREEKRVRAAFGAALRAARKRAGFTQADAAELVGIATEVFGRMERGQMFPSVPTLLALGHALRAEPNELLAMEPMGRGTGKGWPLASLAEGLPDTVDARRVLRKLPGLTSHQIRLVAQLVYQLAGGQ